MMSDIVGIVVFVLFIGVFGGLAVYDTVARLREFKKTSAQERIWRTKLLLVLEENTAYQKSIAEYLGSIGCVFERMEEFEDDLEMFDVGGID